MVTQPFHNSQNITLQEQPTYKVFISDIKKSLCSRPTLAGRT